MVRALVGLLGKNPFKPLQRHMELVMECVRLVPTLAEAAAGGEFERVGELRKVITKAEHEADLAKDTLRDHLPRSLFLPVSRGDLLQLLHNQDDIADGAEDAAIVASLKRLELPEALRPAFSRFVATCLEAAEQARVVVGRLDELLEAGFTGPEAAEVLELINEIGQREWEADKQAFSFGRELLASEEPLDPVDVILWMRLVEAIGDIANAAEEVGDHLRLMLSR